MGSDAGVVVVGGGIVGLSTAMAVLQRYPSTKLVLLEKEPSPARHQSGHNSGVIHSGIYYRPGSLKARFTVEGARQMVAFALRHGIVHEVCGKVVVATDTSEVPRLRELFHRAEANGVPAVAMLDRDELREIEPNVEGVSALRVGSTGIIDYVAVAEKCAEEVTAAGGEIRLSCEVLAIRRDSSDFVVETSAGEVHTRHLINCAGLHSDVVARLAGCKPSVRILPFRGEYYEVVAGRRELVRSLIYPVPNPAFPFLGVHFTRMVGGGIEAGPNAVLSLKREGYGKTDFDVSDALATLGYPGFWRLAAKHWRAGVGEIYRSYSKAAFVKELQKMVPSLRKDDLRPGGSGVRAQAVAADGRMIDDFVIQAMGGAVHVLNAPSPAATASLPIGRAVAAEAAKYFGWE